MKMENSLRAEKKWQSVQDQTPQRADRLACGPSIIEFE